MGTKQQEVSLMFEGKGCLGKAHPDEPIFVLRAQDMLAPAVIELWADSAAKAGCDPAKVAEARELAAAMFAWPNRKYPD